MAQQLPSLPSIRSSMETVQVFDQISVISEKDQLIFEFKLISSGLPVSFMVLIFGKLDYSKSC